MPATSPRWVSAVALGLLAGLLPGCDPTVCMRNSECARGYTCSATVCVPRGDAGGAPTPAPDPGGGSGGGTDAGTAPGDAGTDAGGFVLP